jgi:hypothetical protein
MAAIMIGFAHTETFFYRLCIAGFTPRMTFRSAVNQMAEGCVFLGDLNIFAVHIKNVGMHAGKRMKTCQQTKQMLVVKQNIQALTHLY